MFTVDTWIAKLAFIRVGLAACAVDPPCDAPTSSGLGLPPSMSATNAHRLRCLRHPPRSHLLKSPLLIRCYATPAIGPKPTSKRAHLGTTASLFVLNVTARVAAHHGTTADLFVFSRQPKSFAQVVALKYRRLCLGMMLNKSRIQGVWDVQTTNIGLSP